MTSLALHVWTLAHAFETRLAEALAPLDLTVPAFRLVGELMAAPDGLRTGELARRLGVRPPSVTVMVARLVALGVVTTGPDPDDGRATRIRLADGAPLGPGHDILAELDRVLADAAHPEGANATAELLSRLADALADTSPRPA